MFVYGNFPLICEVTVGDIFYLSGLLLGQEGLHVIIISLSTSKQGGGGRGEGAEVTRARRVNMNIFFVSFFKIKGVFFIKEAT